MSCEAFAFAGRTAYGLIKRNTGAAVAGVYSKAAYLLCGKDMIMLCAPGYGYIPFGVEPADADMLPQVADALNTTAGVRFENESIIIPAAGGNNIIVRVSPSRVPEAPAHAQPDPDRICAAADLLAKLIPRDCRGLAPLSGRGGRLADESTAGKANIYCATARKYVQSGLYGSDPAALLRLIGLGQGLTPSGDDFTTAVLETMFYFDRGRAFAAELAALTEAAAEKMTSLVSCAFLRAAAANERFEITDGFLASLARTDGSRDFDGSPLHRLLTVGASSGSDMAAGAILAAASLTEQT